MPLSAINSVYYEAGFKNTAIKALSKEIQKFHGYEITIIYKSSSFKVSIGAIMVSTDRGNYTYSMWDHSKACLDCLRSNDFPITGIKIFSIICNNIYIQTDRLDPFKDRIKPGLHRI